MEVLLSASNSTNVIAWTCVFILAHYRVWPMFEGLRCTGSVEQRPNLLALLLVLARID
jgi:hypothetical protein